MFRTLAAAIILVATTAPAQIASYETSRPAPVKGDPDKIVCKKVEKIGTRLGAKKVCMTVHEWQIRTEGDREHTEKIQAGAELCPIRPC